jgi:hypothetical protein
MDGPDPPVGGGWYGVEMYSLGPVGAAEIVVPVRGAAGGSEAARAGGWTIGTIPGPAWGPTAPCCSASLAVSDSNEDGRPREDVAGNGMGTSGDDDESERVDGEGD